MLTRRQALTAALAALARAIGAAGPAAAQAPFVLRGAAPADVPLMIVYLSAADCSFCRSWEQSRRPGFTKSPEGQRVPIREIARKTLRRPLADADWPDDLKWIPSATSVPQATPTFVLVETDKILAIAVGTGGFERYIVPKIRQALSM